MGLRNYVVEGVSGAGKTTVCRELQRRGIDAVNGDTELAYQGDPITGEPTDVRSHWTHLWDGAAVRSRVADRSMPVTFFCGGSRNLDRLRHLFDGLLVLEIDEPLLLERLHRRGPDEFGGAREELALVRNLHRSRAGLPPGAMSIDAGRPIRQVVDDILDRLGCASEEPGGAPERD